MIVVVDYGLGNLRSITNALDQLGIINLISSKSSVIRQAGGLILPGVGAAGVGMTNLKKSGLDKILIREIKSGKPIFGICLGMQLLFDRSEEGDVACLGILKGDVRKFSKEKKVPQIGWNQVKYQMSNVKFQNILSKLFNGIKNGSYFYFVNSYYCCPEDQSIIAATTDYGEEFASVIVKENITTVQFHPEKSGETGLKLIRNYWENIVC